jgi:hypothetical protein
MFIDGATERRKIERFPQPRLRAISLIYPLLPMARRQREWQTTIKASTSSSVQTSSVP